MKTQRILLAADFTPSPVDISFSFYRMKSGMFRIGCNKFKIFFFVIINNAINMMHNFFSGQVSPNMFLHNEAMLKDISPNIRKLMFLIHNLNISRRKPPFSTFPIIMIFPRKIRTLFPFMPRDKSFFKSCWWCRATLFPCGWRANSFFKSCFWYKMFPYPIGKVTLFRTKFSSFVGSFIRFCTFKAIIYHILIISLIAGFSNIVFAQETTFPPLEITEEDASPSCFGYKIKFANSNVTDNGDGTCSIADQTGAGGGDPILIDTTAVGDAAGVDLTGGTTGIDITFNAAVSPDTATFGIDATELEALTWGAGGNASNIWTFNLSGTDPVVTFNSGAVVVTGALSATNLSGTNTGDNDQVGVVTLNKWCIGDGTLVQCTEDTPAGDNITVNTTAATNANFLDNIYIDIALDAAATPDDVTWKFNFNAASGDIALLTNEVALALNGLVSEGLTDDTIEGRLAFPDWATSDKVITFQDATHTVVGRDTTDTLTNKTMTAAGNVIEADTVITNANLTGEVTSVGNATTIADSVTVTGWELGVATAATSLTSPAFISNNADPADAGIVRLGNAENIAWEASPAGADVTLKVDASGILQASGALNAGGAITGSNLSGTNTGDNTVATTGDSATAFFSTGTLEVAIGGTGTTTSTGTGAVVLGTSPTFTTGLTIPVGGLTNDSVVDADLAITESINLPIYSAKLTGAFVVQTIGGGDASTQGAQIDAGEGSWRLLFDATIDEAAVYQIRLPDYWTAHSEIKIAYSMTSATSGTVEFEAAVMCTTPGDAADIVTASFANAATATETVPGTVGYLSNLNITVTDDSCAASDMLWIYVSMDADDPANSTATGDTEIVGVNYEFTR